MKIIVCDDTKDPLEGVVVALNEMKPSNSPPVELISGSDVSEYAKQLEARRRSAAGHTLPSTMSAPEWGEHPFDSVDLLILDYNYVDLDDISGLTGQRLAYLARCYSSCKYIIVLNQFGKSRFDLTLQGHLETYADLHIGSDHIANPGLWKTSEWEEYRPWYWPVLPDAVDRFDRRVAEVSEKMDARILDVLRLESLASSLPRSVKQFLRQENGTFAEFAESSGEGLELTDKPFHHSTSARVVASRIAKWLETRVFVAQDILIDVPRLLSRFPSLLEGGTLAKLENSPLTPKLVDSLALGESSAAVHLYPAANWLSRPAWFRNEVMNDMKLPENVDRLPTDNEFRFVEDSSRFLASASVRGFVADLASPFVQRYVCRKAFPEVEYQPSVRFSL